MLYSIKLQGLVLVFLHGIASLPFCVCYAISSISHITNCPISQAAHGIARRPEIRPLRPSFRALSTVSTLSAAELIQEASSHVTLSPAAQWHQRRRLEMLRKYPEAIANLHRPNRLSSWLTLSLLLLCNASLFGLSVVSGRLNIPIVLLLALFPGSLLSLWTLQILHDVKHGALFPKHKEAILFWSSLPSAFGYFLYLQFGHLSHHRALGDETSTSLRQIFDSKRTDFEDGDLLFVAHRMKLKGLLGPVWKDQILSISNFGFQRWKEGYPIRNSLVFTISFLLERFLLIINDLVVALAGKNYFFSHKPQEFHDICANYCRWAVAVRIGICYWAKNWKPLLFLFFSETLWSLPPHPACAMFVTNHGSVRNDKTKTCVPSSSTYAGRWYSILTLGTNYHVEHHDFPTVPLHRLGRLREVAPEYYRVGSGDRLWGIMKKAFGYPEFYACMNSATGI